MILTTTSLFSSILLGGVFKHFLFSPRTLKKMIPILTCAYFFKWVGSTTNQITIWEPLFVFCQPIVHTNRNFAKDSSDLCRFGEGLRTSATRTPIRGDVDGTEKCLVVEGGGCKLLWLYLFSKWPLFWLEKTLVFFGGWPFGWKKRLFFWREVDLQT